MNFSSILSDLAGNNSGANSVNSGMSQMGDTVRGMTSNLPGGLAGGAVAGGLMALLVSNKSVRKTAGSAAKYGGAALLGGLAYKAYNNWQQRPANPPAQAPAAGHPQHTGQSQFSVPADSFRQEAQTHIQQPQESGAFHLVLIKAMIAAARADGQIDSDEQRKISDAIDKMNLDSDAKNELLQLFLKPLSISDVIEGVTSLEQKSEVYLASLLAIDLDHETEYAYLANLAKALELPEGLEQHLRQQAMSAVVEAA
ncbi:MAG: tellurite resistance TerB family protein [Candidatus Pelagadaptatus aseana]|uniref:tellurite resistance TerB family protein n=1 Tax=Candidatus Pelagadaptatus aseana TaxID=3120508 RepID=UPI0039B296AD